MAKEIKALADALMTSPALDSINAYGGTLVQSLNDLIVLTKEASQFFGDTQQYNFSKLADGVRVWREVDPLAPAERQLIMHAGVNDPEPPQTSGETVIVEPPIFSR